jgi:hypothetical protein
LVRFVETLTTFDAESPDGAILSAAKKRETMSVSQKKKIRDFSSSHSFLQGKLEIF